MAQPGGRVRVHPPRWMDGLCSARRWTSQTVEYEAGMAQQQPIPIERREHDGRGGFFVEREGIRLAEMTYVRVDDKRIIVDHTHVDERLRGLGVARRLLDAAVGWARDSGTSVSATCPYAKAQFEKDASIQDVYER